MSRLPVTIAERQRQQALARIGERCLQADIAVVIQHTKPPKINHDLVGNVCERPTVVARCPVAAIRPALVNGKPSLEVDEKKCICCGACYPPCPPMQINDPEYSKLAIWVGGKNSNARSKPTFHKMVAAGRVAAAEGFEARRHALDVRLGFLRAPLAPPAVDALRELAAWLGTPPTAQVAVRSSALREDVPGASFAGQFDSFLGVTGEADLHTAVRACWASLWATRALRYMQAHDVDPAHTAMAVLVQHMVAARAAGGRAVDKLHSKIFRV